jgi:hypothetical protein
MSEISEGKTRVTVTLADDIVGWVDANITAKRFANRSHALEYGAEVLKRLSDGVGTDRRWWEMVEVNENGEQCFPLMTSPEDAVQLMFPKYTAVSEPTELTGWTRTEGFEHDNGYRLPHVYLRTVRRVEVEMATDESQNIVRIRYRPAHDIRRHYPIALEFWYNLKNMRWPSTRLLPIDGNELIFDLGKLADRAVWVAEDLNAFSADEKKISCLVE